MSILDLTKSSAEAIIDSRELALITFSTTGCPSCRAFSETFEAASQRHPDIAFCRVDTSRETDLARSFEVSSVPMTAILRDQILLVMQPGAISAEILEDLIERARSLDMDALRRDVSNKSEETES
jgi:thioredoxin